MTIVLYVQLWEHSSKQKPGKGKGYLFQIPQTARAGAFPATLPDRPLPVISSTSSFTNREAKRVFRVLGTPGPLKTQYLLPVSCPETNSLSFLTNWNSLPNLSAQRASNPSHPSSEPLLILLKRMQRVLAHISWSVPASQVSMSINYSRGGGLCKVDSFLWISRHLLFAPEESGHTP